MRVNLTGIARSALSLGLDFSSDVSSRTSRLWRLYGRTLLNEIRDGYRNAPDTPDALPYRLYEQHLSGTPEHMERFRNVMAETGIFSHLLDIDWVETLTTDANVEVTSLFRRIRGAENVYFSYRNRLESVRGARNLDVKVQNEVLPIWEFLEDEPIGAYTRFSLALRTLPSRFHDLFSFAWKMFGNFVVLPLGFIAISVIALPLWFSTNARAWAARAKISLLMRFDPQTSELAPRLSEYETKYTHEPSSIAEMANLAGKTGMLKQLVGSGWIDQVPLADRVLITSLFRRLVSNPKVMLQAASADSQHAISVLHQVDVPQLNLPNMYQMAERKLFGEISSQERTVQTAGNVAAKKAVAAPKRETKQASSEQCLKSQGWFARPTGTFSRIEEAILGRYYQKALKFYDDPKLVQTLSEDELAKFAAFCGYQGKLMSPASPIGRALAKSEDVAALFDRTISLADKKIHAGEYLFAEVKDAPNNDIRKLWRIADERMLENDEVGVVGIIGAMSAVYASIPQNQVNGQYIANDTFMVSSLYDILEKAQYWVDWHEEKPSVLLAFAHSAILAGHEGLIQTLFGIIQNDSRIRPIFKSMLEGAYLGRGIHSLGTFKVGTLEGRVSIPPLLEISPKRKTLCLVEGAANTDNLALLQGLSRNVVCTPVQPVDASRFPSAVKQVQVEDLIPMYSAEDMEISKEVDRLTSILITAVTQKFAEDEDGREWADFVEIAHATVFFSIYREVMAVKLIEKFVAQAGDYDQVIFLLRNGRSLGTFIKPVIKAVGRENVFFSIKSRRKEDQDKCIAAIQNVDGKPSKPKVQPVKDANWRNGFETWMSNVEDYHKQEVEDLDTDSYALHLLEHVNGYFDSYANLIKVNLAYNDVELITSASHQMLNDYVEGNQIKRFQRRHTLTRIIPRTQPPSASGWMPMLNASIDGCFDKVKSPLFPTHKEMILNRAQNHLSLLLVQILDLSAYFKARFEMKAPTNIFTGPNQHMASRAASIWGKKMGIPVYDFLILANTDHYRYRPPIADYVYLYDGWYRDIYENFFGMKPDQIRVSGPLFDYGKRLTRRSTTVNKAGDRQHIAFFSQSANFDVNRMILEDVCKTIAGRLDVYLTVKLHPHESPANVDRYKEIARELGVSDNISVWHKDADSIDIVNQADLVVQSFSNIGLDSFLLKKPVITVKFSGKPHARIFLYEKGIGKEVRTRIALRKATKAFLDDPKAREMIAKKAKSFAKKNAHFLRPDNAERVMKEVIEDIAQMSENSENNRNRRGDNV